MSGFNGSGIFQISGVGLPYTSGTIISSATANTLNSDLAVGLSNCITKDGQQVITSNIGWNNHNINNLSSLGIGTATPSGQMQVVSGATTNFIINSSGNVGIGTSSPVGRLTIQGAAGTNGINQGIGLLYSNGTQYGAFGLNNTTGWPQLMARVGAGLTFHVNSDLSTTGEAMRIDSSGNVGIGTANALFRGYIESYDPDRGIIAAVSNGPATATTGSQLGFHQGGIAYWTIGQPGGVNAFAIWKNRWTGLDGQEVLRIDSSGNLGLGVTPSSWISNAKAIQVGSFLAAWTGSNGSSNLGFGVYEGGAVNTYKYLTTGDSPTLYQQLTGYHKWYTAPSGTAGNTITAFATPKMTLNASGNLGLNVTPSNWSSTYKAIDINNAGISATSANQLNIGTNSYYDGFNWVYKDSTNTVAQYRQTGYSHQWYGGFSGFAGNPITYYPVMSASLAGFTVGDSNSLGLVSSSNGMNYESAKLTLNCASGFTGREIVVFGVNGTAIGTITQLSGSQVAYNTSSDYRLKEDIQPMTGALAKIEALNPVTYKWKADGSDGEGFIAHELAQVCPIAVTGTKDAVDEDGKPKYQGIDTSFLVATLVAAIKEQQETIAQLTARVEALES